MILYSKSHLHAYVYISMEISGCFDYHIRHDIAVFFDF